MNDIDLPNKKYGGGLETIECMYLLNELIGWLPLLLDVIKFNVLQHLVDFE